MLFDDVVGDRDEGLMRAFPAFDLGLAAYPLNPLVGARRRIAGLGGLPVFRNSAIFFAVDDAAMTPGASAMVGDE
jgi:hypothetical protein